MHHIINCLCIFLLHLRLASLTNYCDICNNESHTMCKYKEGPDASCIKYEKIYMTSELQQLIVNLHNKLRNNVALGLESRGNPGPQPSASRMFTLKWDQELAEIAQRWVETCFPLKKANQHDECRNVDRFNVGQNIISINDDHMQESNFITVILYWYNNVSYMNSENINSYDGDNGDYTQLVWGETKFVGCAHASFVENNSESSSRIHRFICNYGPAGNIADKPIYLQGEPCSECKLSDRYICDKDFPGLCTDNFINDKKIQLNGILQAYEMAKNLEKGNSKDVKKNSKVADLFHALNKTISKQNYNELSYSEILLDYLLKALDNHKHQQKSLKEALDLSRYKQKSDAAKNMEVFIKMKEFDQKKQIQNKFIQEFTSADDLTKFPMGRILRESDYKKVDGVWNDGRCRCNYIFRSNSSVPQIHVLLWLLLSCMLRRM